MPRIFIKKIQNIIFKVYNDIRRQQWMKVQQMLHQDQPRATRAQAEGERENGLVGHVLADIDHNSLDRS